MDYVFRCVYGKMRFSFNQLFALVAVASVFNLPSRKNDFNAVLSNLSEVFLQSTDATVLQNCSFAITSLAKEEHARSGEALLQLKNIVRTLRDRLLELFEDKAAGHSGDGEEKEDSDDEKLSPTDIEHAICLAIRRLGILSKRWDLAVLLGEDGKKGSGDSEIDSLHKAVAEIIAKDLQARKVVIQQGEDETNGSPEIPKIWKSGSAQLHVMLAESVGQALSFLLSALAWRINREVALIVQKESPVEDDTDAKEHVAVRMRDRLEKLVALCFDQYIEKDDDFDSYSEEHIDFATKVQMEAGRVAGDLRSLCPKAWSDAESPLLRSLALTEDGHLIGGFVRFLRSQEEKLRANELSEKESAPAVESLLLPLARGLTANWKLGNRREAGAGLGHITGSGQESSRLVASMSKVLKKIEPVRLLEAHMACLRQDYEEWADEEPEELGSRPTEDEIEAHEVAEKAHKDKVSHGARYECECYVLQSLTLLILSFTVCIPRAASIPAVHFTWGW
jgi:cohesin complex subunit SA-1/2